MLVTDWCLLHKQSKAHCDKLVTLEIYCVRIWIHQQIVLKPNKTNFKTKV